MNDSKGNKFNVGDVLVSTECPDTDPGICCESITGKVAYFRRNDFGYFPIPEPFCLSQGSLKASKWIKRIDYRFA